MTKTGDCATKNEIPAVVNKPNTIHRYTERINGRTSILGSARQFCWAKTPSALLLLSKSKLFMLSPQTHAKHLIYLQNTLYYTLYQNYVSPQYLGALELDF